MNRGPRRHRACHIVTTALASVSILLLLPSMVVAGQTGTAAQQSSTHSTQTSGATTASENSTTSVHDATPGHEGCTKEDAISERWESLAADGSRTGHGGARTGPASRANVSALPVVQNVLILLVAAAVGAAGGYAVHRFGLFDRMARLKGAGL